jgi:hypothetical protein
LKRECRACQKIFRTDVELTDHVRLSHLQEPGMSFPFAGVGPREPEMSRSPSPLNDYLARHETSRNHSTRDSGASPPDRSPKRKKADKHQRDKSTESAVHRPMRKKR